jgi:hypothetical protein
MAINGALLFTVFLLLFIRPSMGFSTTSIPPDKTLRTWVQEMKTTPKGPFFRIRWFCQDGTILPPKAYACRDHSGGVQHGEWNTRTQQLRAQGYKIANVLAGLDVPLFTRQTDAGSTFKQIVLEQFLIAIDDGWIWRRARFYRGALQAEDETRGARDLLVGLLHEPGWATQGFLPLRIGARFLAHGQDTSSVLTVRESATTLSDKDPGFWPLRIKIHSKPDREDALRVRQYATKVRDDAHRAELERLAANIDTIYTSAVAPRALEYLANRLTDNPRLAGAVQNGATALVSTEETDRQFALTGQLMALLRDQLPNIRSAENRLIALDASLDLERQHFAAGTALRERLASATRRDQLSWLHGSANALYGVGLISAREADALRETFAQLAEDDVRLSTDKAGLDYLAVGPTWSSQWLRFHFALTMRKFAIIEPRVELFIQDQLRGSPLLFYAGILDRLLQDANRLAGVRYQVFDKEMGIGLRSLNPGLARGTLRLTPNDGARFDPDGIHLLPETTAELPPVTGILTAGEGNSLSHVQLLARNLGIPNVSVDEALIPQLAAREGTRVILAVSPAGSVQLIEDRGQLNECFNQKQRSPETLIRPDLNKLNLHDRVFTPTRSLRATDSGRIVGPKAAKLGELNHHFPEAVAAGLAIPFGVFRELLSQPMTGEAADVFTWMVTQYATLRTMAQGSPAHIKATETFRQRLQDWILHADAGEPFRQQLRTAMDQVFGQDGTYGVFVRSDTNVEDLPEFTGAGLNLTVPHVVGFDRVLHAISRVWASPFRQRAFAWRQSHMEEPQHVYPAVLLMLGVPAEKSGVMVTQDIDTGEPGWLSVAVNEGVEGAVDGQAAESLRIHLATGKVRLLAQATAPTRRILQPQGGVAKIPASGADRVLRQDEIAQLIALARELPTRFPEFKDAADQLAPADIEFGFLKGKLKLFQIRPFLESSRARSNQYLQELDHHIGQRTTIVTMDAVPKENAP